MSDEQQEQPLISPGLLLKTAREKLNLSTKDIADRLCLRNGLIQDIETDTYDQNISLTFIKGYLKSYAKQVGVSEEAIISAFDNLKTQKKEPAKLQSFSKRLAHQAHDDKLMLVTYLIVALVIALVFVWWLQQSDSSAVPKTVKTTMASPVVESDKAQEQTSQVVSDDDLATAPLVSLPNDNQQEDNTTDIPETVIISEVSPSEQNISTDFELSPSRQESLTEESLPVDKVEIVFTFKNECWMKLTDGTGEDIAYGTKANGRVMPVSGVPPFSVILCSPDAVDISYAGKQVDLSKFRVGTSANFTLPFIE